MTATAETNEGAPEPGAPEGASTATAGAAEGGTPELEALRKEKAELYDRLQRVSAEFQNFQKRTQRDRAKWQQDAARDVVLGFFSVVDSLDLAVGAFDKEGADPKALRKGVELVRDELRRRLEANGVVAMAIAPGAPFDPERHQAVVFEAVEGLAKDEVGQVFRAGWLVGDQVLRPAQVSVRKPK